MGFRGWEAHITEMQNCEQQKSMNRIQFTRIIWFEALVYRVDRSSEHRWLALLEDALCREVQRVGADLKIAKNALRFGKLRTSLEEARDMVRFVFGPWQCLREVSGNLERTVSNRLEDTTYDAFELLRSSFDDGLKQFLWRAVLCQLAPGTQVVEDERGRPNHLKSEMAFRMLRESTQVLSCAGKLFDTKVKEAEEFLLMHQDASARTQQALQCMFVEEHINTIQRDVIARLQVVVDELSTPGGVKKMQDYFFNLPDIDKVLQLVPSEASHTSRLTSKAGPVNAKAFAENVRSEAYIFVQSSFGAVMSTAVRNIDEENWSGLHERR